MKKIITGLFFLTVAANLSAQSGYDYRVGDNFRVGSHNPALLPASVSGSKLQATFGKANGRLIDFNSSPDSYDFGFGAESLRSVGKTRFFGGIGYDYMRGRQMRGSMFTNSGEFPVDIVEYTPGTKNREQYSLYGSFAAPLTDRFTIGFGLDYCSSNYAKRKDLRHKNSKMDLDCRGGVSFGDSQGNNLIGLSGFYVRKTEKVVAEQIGNLGLTYDAFFNKGNWYGVESLWTGSGIHLTETGLQYFPVAENRYGAALQGAFKVGGVGFDTDFSAGTSDGQTGERGIVWHRYHSRFLTGRMQIDSRFAIDSHYSVRCALLVEVDYRQLVNREAVSGRETEGGITQTVVYAYNTIYSERLLKENIELRAELFDNSSTQSVPLLQLRAGADVEQCSGVSSLMYPIYKNRYYTTLSPYANVIWARRSGANSFGAKAGYRYHFGSGNRERTFGSSTDMTLGSYADHNDLCALYEWEWLTKPRHTLSATLRYGRTLRNAMTPFVEAGYSFALSTVHLSYIEGRQRSIVSIAIGTEF